MVLYTLISRAIAIYLHPGFARERATASARQDTKSWDKWIVPLIALWLPLISVVLAGLDQRFGWTPPLPIALNWAGLFLLTIGYSIGAWAMAVNAFFSSHVRIQKDRKHHVVTSGPYSIVRHPAYITGAVAMLGLPLLLDCLLSYLPVLLICTGIVIRTQLEDRTLIAELPGYKDYAEKVRFRLIPGIW
jgi:protein-S-isoprenylcysteine O-methyltransferase Ste14